MTIVVATVVAALLCLAGAPYSGAAHPHRARPGNRRWYVGARRSRSVLTATAAVSVLLGAARGALLVLAATHQ